MMKTIIKVLILLNISSLIVTQVMEIIVPDNQTQPQPERPYCFRFTWIGPKYNEESKFQNATCDDIVRSSKEVPCTRPLIVTS